MQFLDFFLYVVDHLQTQVKRTKQRAAICWPELKKDPQPVRGQTPLFIALIQNQSVAKGGPSCRVGQSLSDFSTVQSDQLSGIRKVACKSAIRRPELS